MRTKLFRLWLLTLMGLSMSLSASAQFSGGTGTEANPFQIKTAEDLNNVRNYIGNSHADKHFRLMNDVDLTVFLSNYSEGWSPIGDGNNHFTGYFHGSGYQIKGLWINRPLNYMALFGTNSGIIDSLAVVVSNKNITGREYVGGLVALNYHYGLIFQCFATGGSISGTSYCGGLIGQNENGIVINCYATTSSSASNSSSGGLIGNNTGIVNNCYATGSSASRECSGGLIGTNWGTVNNCYASGSSSVSYYYSGGLIGFLYGGEITNCYAIGEVSCHVDNCVRDESRPLVIAL